MVTCASHENPALGPVAALGSRLARLLSTNHQARGAPAPAVIWLLLPAGERPKEEPLGRGRWGDKPELWPGRALLPSRSWATARYRSKRKPSIQSLLRSFLS